MKSKSIKLVQLFTLLFAFVLGSTHVRAADEYGIFERILEASGSFNDTTAALEKALAESKLTLHAKRDLVYTDKVQQARVYIVTSPAYMEAAKDEAPETASAQILRIGVYEYGEGKKVHINIGNPAAHAMVFYSGSKNYDKLLAAARATEQEMKDIAAKVPGKQVIVQLEPVRTEKTLNKFNGDGPAKMMAKFRNWKESQNEVIKDKPENFNATVARVEKTLAASQDKGVDDSSGWRLLSKIPVGANAVYFGITNDYTENKCIRINSDFRSDGKTKDAPYPGVDHAPAMPMEVLVINDGKDVKVVQYGEMWRMQLYFWDSGYMAFAKNTLIPSIIFSSIDHTLTSTASAQADATPAAAK
ncbi:MAG: hypothetical protein HY081_02310 [Gammaproteobacteria bacterium]|nr:hypothetical protein [Gammaproteobacteria bacterium]